MKAKISADDYEKLSEYIHTIDTNEAQPEQPYWLSSEYGYDEGKSYCFDCMKSIEPNGSWGEEWDGGFCSESDSCVSCEKCGKLLDYTLTDCGVESELEHYAEHPPENLDDENTCFHLARIACGLYKDEQRMKLLAIFENISS